jgi:hypothetical protein
MVKVGIISNPGSKRNRIPGALDKVYEIAKGYNVDLFWEVADYSNGGPVSCTLYQPAIERMLRADIDVLVVNSGDGGQHLVETELFAQGLQAHEFPVLANARGGTINVRAISAGFSQRNWLKASLGIEDTVNVFTLREILSSLEKNSEIDYTPRTLIHSHSIEGNDRNYKDLYGFSYGSGFPANLIEEYDIIGGGHMSAIRILFRGIFDKQYRKKLMMGTRSKVTMVNLHGKAKTLGTSFQGLLGLSMDLRMNFGPLAINQETFNGVDEMLYSNFISLQGTNPLNLVKQFIKGNILRPKFCGQASKLMVPGLTSRKLESIVLIEPAGDHKMVIDAEVYQTSGPIILRNTEPLKYLRII